MDSDEAETVENKDETEVRYLITLNYFIEYIEPKKTTDCHLKLK